MGGGAQLSPRTHPLRTHNPKGWPPPFKNQSQPSADSAAHGSLCVREAEGIGQFGGQAGINSAKRMRLPGVGRLPPNLGDLCVGTFFVLREKGRRLEHRKAERAYEQRIELIAFNAKGAAIKPERKLRRFIKSVQAKGLLAPIRKRSSGFFVPPLYHWV